MTPRFNVFLISLATFAAIWIFPKRAHTQVTNWTNATLGPWTTVTNWSSGLPTSASTANIANGGTATLATGTGVYSTLNLGNAAAGSLIISGGTLTGTNATLGVAALGSGTMSSGVWTNSGLLTVGATNNGRFTLSGGTMTAGNVAITPSSTFTGSVILNGGLLLTNSITANSSAGAVLTLNGGTLQATSSNAAFLSGFSNGSLVLGAAGGRINSGTFTVRVNSNLTGSGALTKLGAGTLILTQNNSYLGGTTISSGTLQIGIGGTTGSIVGNVTNSGVLIFGRSDTITYSGVVSGAGSVIQNGPGLLILTGNNGYIGGTTINSGTLQVGNGGATGSIIRNITNNSALIFNRSDTLVFSGTISGPGTVALNGAGTISFTGSNTYTGLTTINSGTLQIGNGGSTGAIVGDVLNNSVMQFNKNNTNIYNGKITGTGTLIMTGTASVVALGGENSYTGGTIIQSGALTIGTAGLVGTGTTGSIVGNVQMTGPDAYLAFSRSDQITFSGLITGTGTVFQGGPGATTLTAPKSYTGTTVAFSGTLIGDTSALQGALFTNTDASLVFSQNNVTTVLSGTIDGPGNVVVNSPGGGVIFDTSHNYTGTTTIQSGELTVNAQLSSTSVLIQSNGALGGIGTLAGNLLNSGSLSPGFNGAGALTVNGNFIQDSSGKLVIQIESNSNFDQLTVRGSAQLNGTLGVQLLNGFTPGNGSEFTILTAAAGITGTFANLDLPQNFPLKVIYDPNAVRLLFTFLNPASASNSIVQILNNALVSSSNFEQIALLLDLFQIPINAVIPSIAGNFQGVLFNITNNQYGQLTTRLAAMRAGVNKVSLQGLSYEPMAQAYAKRQESDHAKRVIAYPREERWDIFVSALGVFSNMSNISDFPNINSVAGLFCMGADYRINEYVSIGVYAGYQGVKSSYRNGVLRNNGVKWGGYATALWEGFYVNGIVGGGAQFLNLHRNIDLNVAQLTARSHPFVGELDSLLGAGYEYQWNSWIFGVNNSIQYTYLGSPSFKESGARNFNLRIDKNNFSSLLYSLGGNISYLWEIAPNYKILPTIGLSWQHEFLNYGQRIGAAFANGMGTPFFFNSPTRARNNAFGIAGITIQIGKALGGWAYFTSQFGGNQIYSNAIQVGLTYNF
ncbi:MAG: hypothetical protein C5B47_04850 [Verrucomicrobia bacterium]|nr:MAG: hypothetical protein C5B47_04850 [Verrucomicrobiota bacterium]